MGARNTFIFYRLQTPRTGNAGQNAACQFINPSQFSTPNRIVPFQFSEFDGAIKQLFFFLTNQGFSLTTNDRLTSNQKLLLVQERIQQR